MRNSPRAGRGRGINRTDAPPRRRAFKDDADMTLMRTTTLAAVIALGLFSATGAAGAEPGIADIQWAQRILTEKGFDIGGRADGRMTPPTRAAIKKFQAASGLPQTGDLDAATVDKMMVGRPAKPGVGALSVPKPGSRVVERDEKPRAAPTQRVGTEGGGDVVNPTIVSGVPQGAGDFQPDRPASGGGAATPRAGEAPTPLGATPAAPVTPRSSSPADWLRPLLAAILAGVLAGFGGIWWLSGRPRRSRDEEPTGRGAAAPRTDPVFEAPRRPSEPDFVAPSRLDPPAPRGAGPRSPATAKTGFAARPLMSERRRPAE